MEAEEANTTGGRPGNWVAKLHRFVRTSNAARPEHCELCAAPIAEAHSHLAEPAKGRLLCVCRPCATLFGNAQGGRYRLVPEVVEMLADFRLGDAEWDAFGIPIGLAFFFRSTAENNVVCFYPGPAGPTQSLLDLAAWSQLVENNPVLARLTPDVQALLVNRVNGARAYYLAPIDHCYGLVGLIRKHWRGVSGGTEAWRAIEDFFTGLVEGAHRHG